MNAIKNAALRKALKIVIPFIVIPSVLLLGETVFEAKRYAFISLVTAALSVALFFCGFERKRVGSRRLIIVAAMTALSVAGRFIPLFKPVTAITIITAVYLGGEAGFLVGSLSALISNFYFGQGPWTPFQMLAWGLIGLIAGFLSRPLKRSKVILAVYGFASGLAFSLVMDIWTVLWYNNSPDLGLYLAALAASAPYTVLYSVSNVGFLVLLSKPLGDKLERIKLKYGV